MKNFIKPVFIAIALLTLYFGNAQQGETIININHNDFGLTEETGQRPESDFFSKYKKARLFDLNNQLKNEHTINVGDTIALQLFQGKSYYAYIDKIHTDINDVLAIRLRMLQHTMGYAIITTTADGKSLLTVEIPELSESYTTIVNPQNSKNYLVEIDPLQQEVLSCGGALNPDENTEKDKAGVLPKKKLFHKTQGLFQKV